MAKRGGKNGKAAGARRKVGKASSTAAGGGDVARPAGLKGLRKEEIAAYFGVHWRTVLLWVKAGCPASRDARKRWRFDLAEVLPWTEAQQKTFRPGRPAEKRDSQADEWRRRAEQAKAELAELDLAEKRGQLVDAVDVEAGRVKRIIAVKEALGRLVRGVPAEVRDQVDERVQEILREFSRGPSASAS